VQVCQKIGGFAQLGAIKKRTFSSDPVPDSILDFTSYFGFRFILQIFIHVVSFAGSKQFNGVVIVFSKCQTKRSVNPHRGTTTILDISSLSASAQ
jgi:hypothetical protein